MSKGIKTFNSSRARAGHSEALNYFPRHPQPQNVFSKREHWAFVSKQKSKLTVNKTGHIEVKWKKRGRREGRKKAEERWKVTKRERREEKEEENGLSGTGSWPSLWDIHSEFILIIGTRATSFSDTLNFGLFISKSSLRKNAHRLWGPARKASESHFLTQGLSRATLSWESQMTQTIL